MGDAGSLESAAAASDGKLRLFLAVEVPETHRRSIDKALRPLRTAIPDAKWTARDSWHVTLKFLGEVPDDRLEEVFRIATESVRDSSNVKSRLTGLGVFPSQRRARVIWIGLEDSDHLLEHLAARMESMFQSGGFRAEGRKLQPHLTVCRLRTPMDLTEIVEAFEEERLEGSTFEISRAVLFRSRLSRSGAAYEALKSLELESV